MNNITDLFFEAAKQYPQNIAIIEDENKITYQDLAEDVKFTAGYLKEKGIKKGDRVLIFVPMSIDLYRIVLSVFYIGATAVFLDEWVSKKRMELCCKIAECKVFIAIPKIKVLSFLSKELRRIPIKLNAKFKKTVKSEKESLDINHPALITFTTGSTGIPKAAVRSHLKLNEQFKALSDEVKPKETDIDITLLPIVLFINLGVGATSVIFKFNQKKPDKINFTKLINLINDLKVNKITSSPFVVNKLASEILTNKISLFGLEKIFTGGAPVFPEDAGLLIKAFSNSQIKIIYGSTEAEPISSVNAEDIVKLKNDLSVKGLYVGDIHKSTKLKIIQIKDEILENLTEDEFIKQEEGTNKIGEIIVSGSHVLDKYFNNPEAFRRNKIIVNGVLWHRTGDSGKVDDAGKLFLTGRCNSLIKKDGSYISPFIYESILQEVKNVDTATVLEINKKIVLICQLKKDTDKEETDIKIKSLNLKYDSIKYIKKIPRDPRHHSKIDYESLRKYLSES